MAVALASPLSTNEETFIRNALLSGLREDGRALLEARAPEFQFHADGSGCTVHLGNTVVSAFVSAYLRPPYGDRPNEGRIRFLVRVSPLAYPDTEKRATPEVEELSRLVERGLHETRAVDVEALAVLPGRLAWHLEIELVALGADGALTDACGLAALASVRSFRRPIARVDDAETGRITVLPSGGEESSPLALHISPVPVTFAHRARGTGLVLDPGAREETACEGMLTVIVTPAGELCGAQKIHGGGCPAGEIARCARLATAVAAERVAGLDEALKAFETARVAARVRRHVGGSATAESRGLLAVPLPTLKKKTETQQDTNVELQAEQGNGFEDDMVVEELVVVQPEEDRPSEQAEEPSSVMQDTPMEVCEGKQEQAGGEVEKSRGDEPLVPAVSDNSKGPAQPAAVTQQSKKKRKKKAAKLNASNMNDDNEDPYAAIASLISQASRSQGASTPDLKSAVKTPSSSQKGKGAKR